MSGKRLQVLEEPALTKKELYVHQTRAKCRSAWNTSIFPAILDSERIRRTKALLAKLNLKGQKIVDLGCGASPFTFPEACVTAVDILPEALGRAPKEVKRVEACLPYISLPEDHFDLVLFTDVIADLEPHLYRLMLSEISALMKRDAYLVCSTELDIHSEDAESHFLSLMKTEFEILESVNSHHRLYSALRGLLDAPMHFVHASRNAQERLKQMQARTGISRLWFYFNSLSWIAPIWRPLTFLNRRLHNRSLLIALERLSQILFGSTSATHTLLLCKRKSLHLDP